MWGALAGAAISAIGSYLSNRRSERMAGNRYQVAVEDMIKAGLNPALMFGSGGPAPMPRTENVGAAGVEGFRGTSSALSSAKQSASQVELNRAATSKTWEETSRTVEATRREGAEADKARADADFAQKTQASRIEQVEKENARLGAQAGLTSAQATKVAQEIKESQAKEALMIQQQRIQGFTERSQKSLEDLVGTEGWKRYLGGYLGQLVGSSARAIGGAISPF